MKRALGVVVIVVLFAGLTAGTTYAEEDMNLECLHEGVLYMQIADHRDEGDSPKQTFATAREFWTMKGTYDRSSGLWTTPAFQKNAINLVYFDPRFSGKSGKNLRDLITEDCMAGHPANYTYRSAKPFKPLQ